jgi:hypothetical protein
MARLPEDVLQVLRHHITIDSAKRAVRITAELDSELYGRVASVLVGLGGKYAGKRDSGSGRHVFKADPAPLVEMVLTTGEDNPGDFYGTPEALADYVAACLDVDTLPPSPVVLEPSYGTGALARAVTKAFAFRVRLDLHLLGIEQNPGLARRAQERAAELNHLTVVHADLLALDAPPMPIAAAVMNPPFGKRPAGPGDWGDPDVYIRHIVKVWSWLPPGGRLIAIAPTGWTFRRQGKAVTLPALIDGETRLSVPQFRAFVERYGRHVETRGKLFEATDIPVTVIVLGTVADQPPAMPELPEELRKQEPKIVDPTEGKDLRTLMAELDESERASRQAMLDLKRTMADILGVRDAAGERCPACAGAVAAEELLDDDGRAWHPACARTVLAQYTVPPSALERELAAIGREVEAGAQALDEVAASIEAPPVPLTLPRRARRERAPAENQLVLEL